MQNKKKTVLEIRREMDAIKFEMSDLISKLSYLTFDLEKIYDEKVSDLELETVNLENEILNLREQIEVKNAMK